MKALTVHPAFAGLIFAGEKTIEVRTWKTNHRGDILITSSNKKLKDTMPGHALCIVNLYDIKKMEKRYCEQAAVTYTEIKNNINSLYAWFLKDVRIIKPIPVKGKLGLWDFNGDVDILGALEDLLKLPENEDAAMYEKYWKPITI